MFSKVCLTLTLIVASFQWSTSRGIVNIPIPLTPSNITCCGEVLQDGTLRLMGPGQYILNTGVTPASLQLPSGHVPGTDGVYVLKFSVQNFYPHYPGYFEATLTFGSQELCSTDGWVTANVTDIVKTCPSPGYIVWDQALPGSGPTGQGYVPAQGNQPLVLTLSNPEGWQLFYSNPSLNFTPQPCQVEPCPY